MAGVRDKIQMQLGKVDCIFAGDFNVDIRNKKPELKYDKFEDESGMESRGGEAAKISKVVKQPN